jgi:hypothetical protein
MQLLPRDCVSSEVGVLGPWVRVVSGAVGEETVMGSLPGRLQPGESGLGNPVFAIVITHEAAPSSRPFDGRRVISCS